MEHEGRKPFSVVKPRTMDNGTDLAKFVTEFNEWKVGANERWEAKSKETVVYQQLPLPLPKMPS